MGGSGTRVGRSQHRSSHFSVDLFLLVLVLPTYSVSLTYQLVFLQQFAQLSLPHPQSSVMHNADQNIKVNYILSEYKDNGNIVG